MHSTRPISVSVRPICSNRTQHQPAFLEQLGRLGALRQKGLVEQCPQLVHRYRRFHAAQVVQLGGAGGVSSELRIQPPANFIVFSMLSIVLSATIITGRM